MKKEFSALRSALRRIGGQLKPVEDVQGIFTPELPVQANSRLYGTLKTHDAVVRVGFDGMRLQLPPTRTCEMSVTGKAWLDERTSTVTVMVNHYRVCDPVPANSGKDADHG